MEVFLVELARPLGEKGWRTIYVMAGELGDFFCRELDRMGSPYVVARFPLSLADLWSLCVDLEKYYPDVIHTTFVSSFDPMVWLLKLMTGARYLLVSDQSSGAAKSKRGPKRLMAQLRGVVAGLFIDRIVAVSNFVKKRDIEAIFLSRPQITTIYNGVELEERDTVLKAPNEIVTIAYAGQLIVEKGVDIFLRAIKELRADCQTAFKVLIAGEGRQAEELQIYCEVNELDQVEFLGQIDWVGRLYKCADIVVVPSQWEEACAFSLIEAMGCGACVVASDAGGNPELIGTDEKAVYCSRD